MTAILLMAWLLPQGAAGQVTIKALRLPSSLCAGEDLTVSFGYRQSNTVVVGHEEASLGHSDQIFLPDGVDCDSGCSYRSPVTFTVFDNNARITSVEDIKFVRLNMEHSYIGDLYMSITCPNEQKADLMRFAGSGSSSCDGAIPSASRHWLTGSNIEQNTYLGMPYDFENSDAPCDASAPDNRPGMGWNYCWSSNTTSGYQYASGDGIIYRDGHAHGGRVDSSNVAAHTNFYHPDESFTSLVGCPLNGTWTIEVVDGFSVDNGYIFEWELTLDASLIPNQCWPAAYGVEGGVVEQNDDSTFRIKAPANVTADSAVLYRFLIITTCGDTVDTSATIVYHPLRESTIDTVVCDGVGYTVGPYMLDSAGHYDLQLATVYGCDSMVHLDLGFYPSYDIHLYDSTCINVPYPFEGTEYSEAGVYRHRLTTVHGCDSLRTLHLFILSRNLKAAIKAVPLIVDASRHDIELHDQSVGHVDMCWMIGGGIYDEPAMTLAYPVELDSLEINLDAVSREGCHDTATVVARYDRSAVFIPNVFTPTEEQNNRWQPSLNDVVESEVWIYNRQGVLVAHLEGLDASWDGAGCPQGVYVYTLHYRTRVRPDWKKELTGTIMLLR